MRRIQLKSSVILNLVDRPSLYFEKGAFYWVEDDVANHVFLKDMILVNEAVAEGPSTEDGQEKAASKRKKGKDNA